MKKNLIDRLFYSIEETSDGEKQVHLFGNIYWNDSDSSQKDYRHAEWTFLYITVEKLKKLLKIDDNFFEYINERVNYLTDITKEEALNICAKYHNGDSGINLHINNVDKNTPCGDYWCEM